VSILVNENGFFLKRPLHIKFRIKFYTILTLYPIKHQSTEKTFSLKKPIKNWGSARILNKCLKKYSTGGAKLNLSR
jgi:hypothetical protein